MTIINPLPILTAFTIVAVIAVFGVLFIRLLVLILSEHRLTRTARLSQNPASSESVEFIAQTDRCSYRATPFLTPAERSFFGALEQAVGRDHRVFAKVRLADIVRPTKGLSRSGWQADFNRISGKHVDFVLCDPGDLKVRAVVELDDRSHNTLASGIQDGIKDRALESAGIPIIRVLVRSSYSLSELQKQIGAVLVASV